MSTGVGSAAEVLETRVLPAVTLIIDYSLDNGFFNTAEKRGAIESAASEIGSRLNDVLAYVPAGSYTVTDPKTFTNTTRTFDVAANAIRVFVAGSALGGSIVGEGGSRWSTGLRSFDRNNDFAPYVGYVGFDNDGSTTWNFSDGGPGVGTNFQSVARHELLHVLGIGIAPSWTSRISGGFFVGAATRAANGGISPAVDFGGGHFAQGTNSIMAPVISSISHPTAVDWAALDDIGWDVSVPATPGQFADVVGRTATGNWWISSNSGASGLSSPTLAGHWSPLAGWRDVQFGDFDGNGLTDIVGRTAGGVWWVGNNTGGTFQNRLMGSWSERAGWQDVTVGDFNGDGRDDIAGRTATGGWYVAQSTGTSFITTRWAGWNSAADWHDVRVGDFNGDGRDDIVARNKFGAWWVARSTGNSFTSTYWGGWNEGAGWRDVLVADFDGNGTDDIAARSGFGGWYVGLSVGTSFSTRHWGNWNEAVGWRDVAVGDFSGDGRTDVIGRTAAGVWLVANNLGASFSTIAAPFGAWVEAAGWRDVQFGQFAGSAKTDILARTSTGAWYIGENTGSGIVFKPFGQWTEGLVWQNVGSGRDFVIPVAGAAALAERGARQTAEPTALPLVPAQRTQSAIAASVVQLPNGAGSLVKREGFISDRSTTSAVDDDRRELAAAAPSEPVVSSIELTLVDKLFGDRELLAALVT